MIKIITFFLDVLSKVKLYLLKRQRKSCMYFHSNLLHQQLLHSSFNKHNKVSNFVPPHSFAFLCVVTAHDDSSLSQPANAQSKFSRLCKNGQSFFFHLCRPKRPVHFKVKIKSGTGRLRTANASSKWTQRRHRV